jgi:RHS repeat-associated protein
LNGGSWTSNGYTAGTYGLIDDLTYTYGTGNQLTQVRDISLLDKGFKSVNNPNSTHYTYDANGNLKSDLNKGILLIEYNVLNLPQVITFTNNRQLQWVYDASGAKLRKMVLENGSVKETRDYVNGVEYKNRLLERVSHSEGAVVLNEYGNDQHEYVLRDHLGNTRVTFRDGTNKGHFFDWNTWSYKNLDPNYDDGIVTKDDIVQINNYYPFGLNMEGDWNGASGNNKYQYNGKEWNDDFGLGWNDYGARFYDPAIARWTAVDPLSEKMRRHSPYNYAFDNPMRFIDPDGMAPAEGPGCGKVIAVFYHGGPDGGGKTTTSDKAGVAGNIYNSTEAIAGSSNREFAGTIIAPGLTSASGVQNGFDFITQNYQEGDQVIIYGYSYGTDVAVDLSTKLQDACIPVNLLVTVDGSDGPLQNSTVNTSIPENVSTNLNVYQTHDSGTSSKVVKSDSGTSNSPGSNGGANTAIDSKQTTVINKNVTAPGTTHGNIQTKAQGTIESKIKEKIQAY